MRWSKFLITFARKLIVLTLGVNMAGSVKVRGDFNGAGEEQNVWVDKRSAFGLEIVSLVESGIAVELESSVVPEDQCITIAEMHNAFHWLVMPTPATP